MHIADVDHGNLGATGIVGGNIPVAVGAALAQKLMGRIASVSASLATAPPTPATSTSRSIWPRLEPARGLRGREQPLRMSVPWVKASKLSDVATAPQPTASPAKWSTAWTPWKYAQLGCQSVDRARHGEGPTLIECKTYRWYGHSHSDPRAYRTREEEAEWKKRDPITVMKDNMQAVANCSPMKNSTPRGIRRPEAGQSHGVQRSFARAPSG
jgi:hypothetical protein